MSDDAMKLFAVVDRKTGEELAYHGDNGPTLSRWLIDLVRRGRDVERTRESRGWKSATKNSEIFAT